MEQSADILRQKPTFPDPIHGFWDLDALAESEQQTPTIIDEYPRWMQSLSEPEANRAFGILIDESLSRPEKVSQLDLDFSRGKSTMSESPHLRQRVIDELLGNSEMRNTLKKWLEKHEIAGMKEVQGRYVKKPGLLRMMEQKHITKPNLKSIFSSHFEQSDLPREKRRLIDIGTWDGELPKALRSIFGSAIGIERHEDRIAELMTGSNDLDYLTPYEGDIVKIMENGLQSAELHGDAFLISHLLYFLTSRVDGSEKDVQLLHWVMRQLSPQGIGVVVLNDIRHDAPLNSRDGLRKFFGVREMNPPMDDYARILGRTGVQTRIIRPSLRIVGRTEEGKKALADVVKFLIPGEARSDERRFDEYLRLIQQNHGGEFLHTLAFLAMYKDPNIAPLEAKQPAYEAEADTTGVARVFSLLQPIREEVQQAVEVKPMPIANVQKPAEEVSTDFSTYYGTIHTLTASDMLILLEKITVETEGIDNDRLQQVLDEIGMARTTYFRLMESQNKLRKLSRDHPDAAGISAINKTTRGSSSAVQASSRIRRRPSREMQRRMVSMPTHHVKTAEAEEETNGDDSVSFTTGSTDAAHEAMKESNDGIEVPSDLTEENEMPQETPKRVTLVLENKPLVASEPPGRFAEKLQLLRSQNALLTQKTMLIERQASVTAAALKLREKTAGDDVSIELPSGMIVTIAGNVQNAFVLALGQPSLEHSSDA